MTTLQNHSLAVFLMNPKLRAVLCTYEAAEGSKKTLFKTFDQTIAVDDIVVVPTAETHRHGMTICKVVEVDAEPDFNSTAKVDWIIGTVELEDHQATLEVEQQAIDFVKAGEKKRQRDQLRADLMAGQEESISNLQIASMGEEPAKPEEAAAAE